LIGVAMALKKRRAEGRPITGIWQRADQVVQQSIQRTLDYQNPDGSFSAQYFRRPASTPDLSIALGTTGHLLEFLTVAMSDQQLNNPQVDLAVQYLCGLFRETQDLALECGALYHAVHGLVLFRQRRMGPREYHWDSSGDDSPAAASSSGGTAARVADGDSDGVSAALARGSIARGSVRVAAESLRGCSFESRWLSLK
jgi:hypothetical protein